MQPKIDFKNVLAQIYATEGNGFVSNETALLAEYDAEQTTENADFAVKMLSIVGVFLATIAFVGFLMVAGLYRSEFGLTLTGIVFITAALVIHKTFDTLLIDTFCISFFTIGIMVLGVGLDGFSVSQNSICLFFMTIGIATILIAQHYLLTFLSVLLIAMSAHWLIFEGGDSSYNVIPFFNAGVTLLLTYLMLHEAQIMARSQKFAKIFAPTRTALILVLLISLLWTQNIQYDLYGEPIINPFIVFSTLPCAIGICYLISKILVILERNTVLSQIIVYSIALILLALTALSPLISGALLVLLLCFYTNYKTGGAIAIVVLIYALSQYYYDLNLTLLQKSGILLASGLLFLLFYFLTQRTFANDEKL